MLEARAENWCKLHPQIVWQCWKIIFLNNTAHIKENRIYRGCSTIVKSNNTVSNYLIKAWDTSRMKMHWIDGKYLGLISNWSISNLKSVTISVAIGNNYHKSICLERKMKINYKKVMKYERLKINLTNC